MKQSKVEETKVEKTENGQVTAQTEEVKETSEVKTEITAADQSEQKAAEKTEKAEEVSVELQEYSPRITAEALNKINGIMSSFSSTFSQADSGRVENLRIATGYILSLIHI